MQDAAIKQLAGLAGYIGDYFSWSGEFGLYVGEDALADQNLSTRTGQLQTKKRSPARLVAVMKKHDGTVQQTHRSRFKKTAAAHASQRANSIAEWIFKSM